MKKRGAQKEQRDSKTIFVALVKDGQILLVENAPKQLPNGAHKPKGWGLPGGGVDGNEGEKHAAGREVEEETGYVLEHEIDKETGKKLYNVDLLYYEPPRGNHLILIVTGKIAGGRLKTTAGEDTISAAWFPVNRLPSGLYNSHRRRITQVLREMKENGMIPPDIATTANTSPH